MTAELFHPKGYFQCVSSVFIHATSSKYSLVAKACLISFGFAVRHSLNVFHWNNSDSFSARGREIGCLPDRTSDMYASVIPRVFAICDCVNFFMVLTGYIRLFLMSIEKNCFKRIKSNKITKYLILKDFCIFLFI